jgi:hypothetical protein
MRAYSQSQGKFIDVPDQGGANVASPTAPTSTDNTSALKQLLGRTLMSKARTPSEAATIYTTFFKDEETAAEAKKKAAQIEADRILTDLENMYFDNKLHKGGRLGQIMGSLEAMANPDSPINRYNNYIKSVRPTLVKAAGDVGNLSETEQQAAIKILPNIALTREEAIKRFADTRSRFSLPNRDYTKLKSYAPTGLGELAKQFGGK